ncbi:hypothetical protein ALC60_07325 [Trachymyrmex zeteki]|uniref:Uncharacterized protein n=1 Tax=Mycetomoellerius zeteki TaxID=64791 RepID=A0A151X055_9HYME|nr:hypothetical protein ALC60_07325 [Trachymyrmex zeteki]
MNTSNPFLISQKSFNPSSSIFIHPNSFPSQNNSSSLTTIRKKWFINLSSVEIPHNIQCFLQLGENFALPFNNKNKIIFECIKSVESSTHRMPIDRRIEVVNLSIPILNNIISSPIFTSPKNKQLLKLESDTVISTDGLLPRVYGLPKIHKPDCPLRIIVSSIDSPLYALATFLHNILFKTIPKADSYIKNSFQFVEKLKKKGTIFSLVDRAFLLSDFTFRKKNLTFILLTFYYITITL